MNACRTPLVTSHHSDVTPLTPTLCVQPVSHCPPITCCVYPAVCQTLCLEGCCERQYWKLYWNPRRLLQLVSFGQLGGFSCHKKKLDLISRTLLSLCHAGCDQWLHCLSSIFSISQNNLLHNFNRYWSETNRSVVSRLLLLALLENRNNVHQLAGTSLKKCAGSNLALEQEYFSTLIADTSEKAGWFQNIPSWMFRVGRIDSFCWHIVPAKTCIYYQEGEKKKKKIVGDRLLSCLILW